jgi:hypothetical protein
VYLFALLYLLSRIPQGVLTALATWAQIISTASLPIALWAIRTAKRDLALERRTAHELEVLRLCAAILQEARSPLWYGRLRTHLLLIPGSKDLPMIRAAMGARASQEMLDAFADKYPDRPPLPDPLPPEPDEFRYRIGAISPADQQTEMEEAIDRRVSR